MTTSQNIDPAVAQLVDPGSGIQREARFFGPGPERMFGVTHLPPRPASAGVVICPSLSAEIPRNIRKEAQLSEIMCRKGFTAQRFHYRGSSHSEGDSSMVTFDTMCADAAAATEFLMERTGVSTVAFAGTRWGAMVAAAMARRFAGAPLLLWDPIVDGASYFKEMFRHQAISSLNDGGQTKASRGFPEEELSRGGSIVVIGYRITGAFYESAKDRRLPQETGPQARAVFLVQMGKRHDLRRDYSSLVQGWLASGIRVETHVVTDAAEGWWLAGVREEPEEVGAPEAPLEGTDLMIRTSADWLAHQLESGVAR